MVTARKKYQQRQLIQKICECGCNQQFETKSNKARFMNNAHYGNYRVGKSRKIYVIKKKFRLNKMYREKPFLLDL